MTDSGELSYFYSYFSVNIFNIMHSFTLFFVRFALAGGSGSRGCGVCGEREEVVANC